MKSIFLLLLISGQFTLATSQITVTSNNYQGLMGTADSVWTYSSTDTSGLAAVIADAGAGKTWSIGGRAFQLQSVGVTKYAPYPDGAPFSSDPGFASSNMVELVGDTTSSAAWYYYILMNDGLSCAGEVTQSVANGTRSFLKSVFTPAFTSYVFPLTYGSQWSGTYESVSTFSTGQADTVPVSYKGAVDGWGTITTPSGSYQCLRLRSEYDSYISLTGTTFSTVSYSFLGTSEVFATIITNANGVPSTVAYFRAAGITEVRETPTSGPAQFSLSQNYPNPFNPTTVISYYIPVRSHVTLTVYDVLGRRVATLVNSEKQPGHHEATFDASTLPSGVYFYRLQAGRLNETKKLVLLK